MSFCLSLTWVTFKLSQTENVRVFVSDWYLNVSLRVINWSADCLVKVRHFTLGVILNVKWICCHNRKCSCYVLISRASFWYQTNFFTKRGEGFEKSERQCIDFIVRIAPPSGRDRARQPATTKWPWCDVKHMRRRCATRLHAGAAANNQNKWIYVFALAFSWTQPLAFLLRISCCHCRCEPGQRWTGGTYEELGDGDQVSGHRLSVINADERIHGRNQSFEFVLFTC